MAHQGYGDYEVRRQLGAAVRLGSAWQFGAALQIVSESVTIKQGSFDDKDFTIDTDAGAVEVFFRVSYKNKDRSTIRNHKS